MLQRLSRGVPPAHAISGKMPVTQRVSPFYSPGSNRYPTQGSVTM
jgi:hypothetical protein